MKIKKRNNVLYYHSNALSDLREFLNVNVLKYSNRKEACNAVANYFRTLNPKTEKELDYFYRTCDDYVYENAYCNVENSCKRRMVKLSQIFKLLDISTCLEIGAGIGSYALSLSNLGYKVSLTRSEDLAFKFLEWRFNKYQLSMSVEDKIYSRYDIIYFLDVIEHLIDPFKFLKGISMFTDTILFIAAFGIHREDMGGYPQHFDFKMNSINKHLISLGYHKVKIKTIFPPLLYTRKPIKEINLCH